MVNTSQSKPWILATALVAFLIGGLTFGQATATHQPADKVTASGSNIEIVGPGTEVTLLTGTLRSSTTSDLLLSVTLECSILTQVTTVGNDDQEAFGRVEVWVEIDGTPVGVTAGDDGHVVFCDRVHQQETTLFDDEDATIRSYLQTRTANGFNWVQLNLGHGIHSIAVKGTLTTAATDGALAQAGIGKRTLIADPTKMANDVAV